MEGKQLKSKLKLPLILLILLAPLISPIVTEVTKGQTEDQIVITFNSDPNYPPIAPINPDPPNGTVDVGVPVTLSVSAYDDTGSELSVFFYNASNDALIGADYNVPSIWGTASVVWNEPLKGRICYWYTIAKDFQYENRSDTWVFATTPNKPPIIHNDEYPANTTINVSVATPYWYVTISDIDNDTFNWTIETSPNIGTAFGTDDVNGTKSCTLSGMQYNTNYTVYVNTTDAGSGGWTNETFWFVTTEQGAPTITNEYPPHRNTKTERQPLCHVDVYDIEGDNLTVYWFENVSGSWILRQTDENVSANSTVYWTFSQASLYSTTYYWRVVVNDSTVNTTGNYYFTTEPQPSEPPPPPPGGGGYTPPPNQHPIANITGPHMGYVNETLLIFAYFSYDPDGYITGYRWDFENNGVYDTEWLKDFIIAHNYSNTGNYSIRLQVEDDDGAVTTSETHSIYIKPLDAKLQLPIPQINGPYYGYNQENVIFNSNGSYDPDGTIVNYTWYFSDGNISYLENPEHTYTEPGNYTVTLKVTDNDNLSNATTTKAIITDRAKKPKEEERELPLTFILLLILIIIALILEFVFLPRGYRITLLIEKLSGSKKNKNKEEETIKKNEPNDDIEPKINEKKDLDQKIDDTKNINGQVDDLLSKLDSK